MSTNRSHFTKDQAVQIFSNIRSVSLPAICKLSVSNSSPSGACVEDCTLVHHLVTELLGESLIIMILCDPVSNHLYLRPFHLPFFMRPRPRVWLFFEFPAIDELLRANFCEPLLS